ncbi:hypothetical protein XELAEV_18000715mg [Xenopus laevis]|uniref:Uncharacterized protein n=1 Tax=Xenopus laevis TaxID=8355 RepID=A0A974BNW7_XENLA|nr:hypothetical protein XELAEV_18000715mg [Xenopus laevis]
MCSSVRILHTGPDWLYNCAGRMGLEVNLLNVWYTPLDIWFLSTPLKILLLQISWMRVVRLLKGYCHRKTCFFQNVSVTVYTRV